MIRCTITSYYNKFDIFIHVQYFVVQGDQGADVNLMYPELFHNFFQHLPHTVGPKSYAYLPDGSQIEGITIVLPTEIVGCGTYHIPYILYPSTYSILLSMKILGISQLLAPPIVNNNWSDSKTT